MSTNSIATQQTEALRVWLDQTNGILRSVIAVAVLLVLWVSLEPFAAAKIAAGGESSDGGNIVNQIGFTLIFAATFMGCILLVPVATVVRLLSFSWIAMLALLAGSVVYAPDPDAAIRAYLFTLFGIVSAAGLVVLPRQADDFSRLLVIAGSVVIALSFAGVILLPQAAIHQGGEVEAQHSGLWRGLFTHKNVAGPVMAAIAFAGFYLWRRGWKWSGFLIGIAACIFVYKSGSKTTAALVPIAVLLVAGFGAAGVRSVGAFAVALAIFGIHALTVGTAFVPLFDDILRTFNETVTFTGRTEIWNFAKDFVFARPWTGYGFDGFWDTATTDNAERYFDQEWNPRSIVHGHNGFLDIALSFGLPALLVSIWLIIIAPAVAYARTLKTRENQLMADFFFMIVAFTGMNAALESFYFSRADPVWLTLVIALFGLRMTNRFVVRTQ
ncbi:MAG: O-antigen ligase [Pseudomonadota bacterium]